MTYRFLRYPGGLTKAVTLSYDDGCKEDARFLETINKYGMKCTFNMVGRIMKKGEPLTSEFIKENILGKGHEVANHGEEHLALDTLDTLEGVNEILQCRLTLEKELGTIIRGMAYADKRLDRFAKPLIYENVKNYLKELDIAYSRSLGDDNDRFELPEDFYCWVPTAHHDNPNLFDYIEKFVNLDVNSLYHAVRHPRLFYMWGHSFEFENKGNWDRLEEICEKLSGKEDTWYATNIEICNYVNAYKSLQYSADRSRVYNPTLYEIWFYTDKKTYSIKPGETIKIG